MRCGGRGGIRMIGIINAGKLKLGSSILKSMWLETGSSLMVRGIDESS